VSLAPGSYFFWASALLAAKTAAAAKAAIEIRRLVTGRIVLSRLVICFVEVSQAARRLASAASVQLIPRRETALLRRGFYD
jgi:hypothetical protein